MPVTTNDFVKEFFGISDCTLAKTEDCRTDDGKPFQKIYFDYCGQEEQICPKCREKLYKHGKRELTIVDTPMGGKAVLFVISFPRRRCSKCGYLWKPVINNVNENRKMTERAYFDIAQRSLRTTFRDVAVDYPLTHVTVKNVFEDFLEDYKDKLRFETPAFLGIDEIKIKKIGEITVITDLEHRTIFDMLKGRNHEVLTAYFKKMPNRERVFWVCSDMYRPFEKSIATTMPNAQWVIDHFHVVMKANEAIDTIRRSLQADMDKTERVNTKKGLAYTLKTRVFDLTPEEASKIRLLRENPKLYPLAVAFDLKEDFFGIWDNNPASKINAQRNFAEWEKQIPEDPIFDSFRDLAKTVHNFYEQIFHYWDCPIAITNGYTECANRLIRETNIRGRGYSFETLRGRSLYRRSNLEKMIKEGRLEIGPSLLARGSLFTTEAAEDESKLDED